MYFEEKDFILQNQTFLDHNRPFSSKNTCKIFKNMYRNEIRLEARDFKPYRL